jgi:hypothetical protein
MELHFTNLLIVVAAGFASPLLLGLIFPASALTLLKRDPKMRARMGDGATAGEREPIVVPSM